MTPDDDPQLSAEQEEQVRRVLADSAPGPAAMPEEVAARLDDVLARLVTERRDAEGSVAAPALVDDAADDRASEDELARRRTRRWPRLLLAAAAVAVVAAGGGPLLRQVTQGGSSGAASAPAMSGAQSDKALSPSGAAGQAPSAQAGGAEAFGAMRLPGPLPRLHTASLDRDLHRLVTRTPGALGALRDAPHAARPGQKHLVDGRAVTTCAVPAAVKGGRLLAVRLDGNRATLVLGPVRDGARVARIYSCDDATDPVVDTSVR